MKFQKLLAASISESEHLVVLILTVNRTHSRRLRLFQSRENVPHGKLRFHYFCFIGSHQFKIYPAIYRQYLRPFWMSRIVSMQARFIVIFT